LYEHVSITEYTSVCNVKYLGRLSHRCRAFYNQFHFGVLEQLIWEWGVQFHFGLLEHSVEAEATHVLLGRSL
jgi:hypothetical protein